MGRKLKSRLTAALAICAFILIAAFLGWQFFTGWSPSREQYPTQGVLVSADSGPIVWPNVQALGADFAYIRATSGSDKRDANFAENFAEAEKSGLRVGAVHRYSLCRLASDQAANFVTTVPRLATALPPVVEFGFMPDCTDRPSRAAVLSELGTFLNQIEHHADKPALLLLRPDFEAEYRLSEAVKNNIWLTGDFFPPDYAAKPWVIWTANSHYAIRGITGPVEWNVVRSEQ